MITFFIVVTLNYYCFRFEFYTEFLEDFVLHDFGKLHHVVSCGVSSVYEYECLILMNSCALVLEAFQSALVDEPSGSQLEVCTSSEIFYFGKFSLQCLECFSIDNGILEETSCTASFRDFGKFFAANVDYCGADVGWRWISYLVVGQIFFDIGIRAVDGRVFAELVNYRQNYCLSFQQVLENAFAVAEAAGLVAHVLYVARVEVQEFHAMYELTGFGSVCTDVLNGTCSYSSRDVRQVFKSVGFVFDAPFHKLVPNFSSLRLDENGLLFSNGRDRAVTWMNSTANGRPVVPRSGYIVEFNALWYNALKFCASMAAEKGDAQRAEDLEKRAELAKQSFVDTFVNEYGYLLDYVDGNMMDWSVRPNMIFAVALDYSPLNQQQMKNVVDICTRELLTPKGLRSLSPKSGGYNPIYVGPQTQRDYAYHQGTAWPWLGGFYMEACLKLYKRSRLSFIERQLVGYEDEMDYHAIGTISELFDGNPPFHGRGAMSFAMNVAEILRTLKLMDKYSYQK